jgi:hypothetical protein
VRVEPELLLGRTQMCVWATDAMQKIYRNKLKSFFQLGMPKRVSKATTLLNRIVDSYLNSPDFNRIRANVVLANSGLQSLETLKKLVTRGLVEVYSSSYDNPYINGNTPASTMSRSEP